MPELPDLEVFSRNLQKKLAGKKLEKLHLLKGANSSLPEKKLKKALERKKLQRVYREGKELRFAFSDETILGIHLMLRGRLYWLEEEKPAKHTLAVFNFSGNLSLALTDPQYRARLTLNPKEAKAPDALSKNAGLAFWKEKLQSKAGIKNLLLDQHVVRGIGNAYADEILWDAGISPFSIAQKIPMLKIKKLASSVKMVLEKAEKQISKSEPGIIGGEIRDFLLIHNAKKKKSPHGAPIQIKVNGGRKTYFTKEQELYM